MLLRVEAKPAMDQLVGLDRAMGSGGRDAAENDIDPGHQLARAERLGDVIVATDLQPKDAVDLPALSVPHGDRSFQSRHNCRRDPRLR